MGKKELEDFDPFFVDLDDDISQDLLAERTARWGTSDVNCCAYDFYWWHCYLSDWANCAHIGWEGMEGLDEDGTIWLLLDFDEGTLTVYKNRRRLGVMQDRLTGEYCWFPSFGDRGDAVSIERGVLP